VFGLIGQGKHDGDASNTHFEKMEKVETAHLPAWVIALIVVYVTACLVGLVFVVVQSQKTGAVQARTQDKSSLGTEVKQTSKPLHVRATYTAPSDDENGEAGDDASNKKNKKAEVKPAEVTMVLGGDVLLHRKPLDSGNNGDGTYSYEHFFEETADVSSDADIAVINQEGMISGESYGYQAENYVFNSPQSLADAEMDAGYDVILKAMNHVYDMGYQGLHDELTYWHEEYPDVPVLGVSDPEGDEELSDYVNNVYICKKNGLKIAILNYTYGANNVPDDSAWEYAANLHNTDKIAEDVSKAREEGAEFVVVCPHWGIEYDTEPSEEETSMAQFFADLGVDAVIGGHPHVLQRGEVLTGESGNTCVVYYSMGNYVASALDTRGVTGGFARLTFKRDENDNHWIESAEFLPTVVCDSGGKALRTYLVSDWTDELAATTNWPGYGRAAVDDHLRSVFGDGYDPETSTHTMDLPSKEEQCSRE
jgi:poly-gamma-glutamate synthesis protein (capsule biosynthesis protein)